MWNGYSRELEDQADRLALQNVLDNGYDPYAAIRFFPLMIEQYGRRPSSAIWSSHESNVMRGSFLTVQLQRLFPTGPGVEATVDTEAFRNMHQALWAP